MSASHSRFPTARVVGIVVVLAAGLLAATANAAAITEAWYRAGDDDSGAVAGNPGNATTIDTAGTLDLAKQGSPLYSADVPDPLALRLGPSLLSLNVTGGDTYQANSAVTTQTTNLGIEVWAKADSAGRLQTPFHLGSGGNGLAIEMSQGNWTGVAGGIFRLDSGVPVEVGEWTHLAMVREGNLNTFYVNGVARVTRTTGYNAPSRTVLGAFDFNGGGRYFDGLVDEARVFTFDEGAFTAGDLNYVPEPGSLLLLLLGAPAVLLMRRPRSRNRRPN
jgi:hypothetical protein